MKSYPSSNHTGPGTFSRRTGLVGVGRLGLGLPLAIAVGAPTGFPVKERGNQQETDQQTLTVATDWSPVDLDPHGAYDAGSGLVMTGTFESLIKLKQGATREFVPSLAESWEPSNDLSTWTFHLRDGVVFHDGSRLNAEAVRASFERLFALALAPSSVLGRFIQTMDQIQVQDDRTIVFNLGRPQLLFEAAMAAPFGTNVVNAALARKHDVEGDWGHGRAKTTSEGLGTGPYRLASFDPLDGVVLERFDDYWGGWDGEHFDRVVIRVVPEVDTRRQLIEQGEADIVENISLDAIESLNRNSSLVVDHQTNLRVSYLALTIAGAMTTPEARQALCWAFPYQEVVQGVYLGYAKQGQGAVSERCHGFAPIAGFTTDLEKARALLVQAGIPAGTKLSTVITVGNPLVQAIAELFKANLAEIGIDLDIQFIEYASYIEMVFGDMPAEERPHLLPAFWQPDYDDAWSHLWPIVSCDAWNSGNAGHYCNDRVHAQLAIARDAAEESTYLTALAEVQRIVAGEDPAGIYFAQPEWITVLRRDVGGFVMNPVVGEIHDYYAMFRIA